MRGSLLPWGHLRPPSLLGLPELGKSTSVLLSSGFSPDQEPGQEGLGGSCRLCSLILAAVLSAVVGPCKGPAMPRLALGPTVSTWALQKLSCVKSFGLARRSIHCPCQAPLALPQAPMQSLPHAPLSSWPPKATPGLSADTRQARQPPILPG